MLFRSVLVEHGMDALSLRTLASRLGVTAPALYAHVDDKADLLRAVADAEFALLADRLRAVTGDTSIARVRGQAIEFIDFVGECPSLYRLMFQFRPDIVPQEAVTELPSASAAVAVAMEAVNQAMDDGYLRREDPVVMSLTIWAATQGAAVLVLYPLGFEPEYERRIVLNIIDSALAGLAPR